MSVSLVYTAALAFLAIKINPAMGIFNMRILAILLGLSYTAVVFPGEAGEYHYTFLTIGEKSGSQVVSYDGEGNVNVRFEFNDRGRGPETETRLRLNGNGVPVAVKITGNNYLQGEVNERFTVSGNTASWQSHIESGQVAFDGSAFFMPNNAAPVFMGMLARALLATESKSLALLPTGQASIA